MSERLELSQNHLIAMSVKNNFDPKYEFEELTCRILNMTTKGVTKRVAYCRKKANTRGSEFVGIQANSKGDQRETILAQNGQKQEDCEHQRIIFKDKSWEALNQDGKIQSVVLVSNSLHIPDGFKNQLFLESESEGVVVCEADTECYILEAQR